ncbi:phosphotransferase enzyme family protein [Lepagella muris]|jgi:hypothetical protein|uniref:Aminoglycoside phosphotransferase family protein n=1 Tax=Lepagella muris TaxID=3032870 RepID=A0AC61RBC6_9BACT|nr:aminoglycoside phosphotransferase family protein [Lepagella muris]TGY76343.1 aminoglycoside phosphotransferase family protein [Lepagella muris]THG51903.1 aminoglycoside phosphotransferase family protein [Bacteroidales bacterium]TKC64312.1 aminoglycoside phosphotransferase family protein [Bacteroidales bacterium]
MDLIEIAKYFKVDGRVESVKSVGEGFINDTYFVKVSSAVPGYILQRKNSNVFKNIPEMMSNIDRVTAHISRKVKEAGGNPLFEVLHVVPTKSGELCYKDESGNYWAMSRLIPDVLAIDRVSDAGIARKGGIGIGRFQRQLADFQEELYDTLPGFHDMRFRFEQWEESLSRDAAGRKDAVKEEIEWIESRKERMMELKRKIEDGTIPMRVAHNDTKINNILFDKKRDVLCVIDLDTVMRAPVLYDFGDAIRSYANTGKEDDSNLDNVEISLDIFRGFAEGYLSQCREALTDAEIDNLAFSALYITFEQVLRFLMDYIDGDTYYKTRYPAHNLVRARAQYKLLRSMEEHYEEMQSIIRSIAAE